MTHTPSWPAAATSRGPLPTLIGSPLASPRALVEAGHGAVAAVGHPHVAARHGHPARLGAHLDRLALRPPLLALTRLTVPAAVSVTQIESGAGGHADRRAAQLGGAARLAAGGVEAGQRAVAAVGHPDRALAGGDALGRVADLDRVALRLAGGVVDAADGAVAGVGHPHRAAGAGDAVGVAAHLHRAAGLRVPASIGVSRAGLRARHPHLAAHHGQAVGTAGDRTPMALVWPGSSSPPPPPPSTRIEHHHGDHRHEQARERGHRRPLLAAACVRELGRWSRCGGGGSGCERGSRPAAARPARAAAAWGSAAAAAGPAA